MYRGVRRQSCRRETHALVVARTVLGNCEWEHRALASVTAAERSSTRVYVCGDNGPLKN